MFQVWSINESYVVVDEEHQPILYILRRSHWMRRLLAIFAAIVVFWNMSLPILGLTLGFGKHKHVNDLLEIAVLISGGAVACFLPYLTAVLLGPQRDIRVFADEQRTKLLLEVKEQSRWIFHSIRFQLLDGAGNVVGSFSKNVFVAFIRKKWRAFEADGRPLLVAIEDSAVKALLRRLLGPMYGLLRTNFVFYSVSDSAEAIKPLGEFNRKFTLTEEYILDMSNDAARTVDRRIAIALGVLLDTAERR